MVSNVTVPEDGAVHLYHTDPVAELRTEGFCSDVCIVAPTLLPDMEPEEPEMVTGDEKPSFSGVRDTGLQFAVSITLPLALGVKFLNHTSPATPFRHFCEVLAMLDIWPEDDVPYFAVPVFSPLDTVHPANAPPHFVGAETLNAVPYVAEDGEDAPFVPPFMV